MKGNNLIPAKPDTVIMPAKKSTGKTTGKEAARSSSRKDMSWEEIGKAVGRKIEEEDWEGRMGKWSGMRCHVRTRGPESAVYGMGFLGSLFYYWTTAPTLWAGVVGLVKAILWPAVLAYGALKTLGL